MNLKTFIILVLVPSLILSQTVETKESAAPPPTEVGFDADFKDLYGEDPTDEDVEDDQAELTELWETHMKDFVAEDMLTFELPGRDSEIFIENIKYTPTKIRGAWFVGHEGENSLDFKVVDPLGKEVYNNKDNKKEGIFYFDTHHQGNFEFRFYNPSFTTTQKVTFVLHCGNATDSLLTSTNIDPLEKKLRTIDKGIRDVHVETKFAAKRLDSHFQKVHSSHRRIYFLHIFESIAILGLTYFQIYYIKRILADKRII
eukprot:TRINITY_DN1493_c0_g1_i6.p1 TRINITY_DN1493_c0_g1~~TRINITY_DN1493_c0_g1_i6.p1  ORF type:complete len:257 (-),score=47.94 TRINITY_DN1493_c0_g1_i6:374-1144(-)